MTDASPTDPTTPHAAPNPGFTLGSSHVLLTGATGFVGQAVLERLLSSHPDTRISLLIRPKSTTSGESRLTTLLKKPVFRTWREAVGEAEVERAVRERITVIQGDLANPGELPGDLDVVIHGASTVSFDPPIDEAFQTNVDGATGIYGALLASGSDPHVVHVSTAYVGGMRKGVRLEASLEHDIDWRIENAAAKSARLRVEMASRQPEVLSSLLAASRAKLGKVGPQAVAADAEAARIEWVTKRLVESGRIRAESLGWTDVYTLTKAFAERAAEELWGTAGHRLSIVRPSIIESALRHPFPGWLDGFKVADPLIMAYGRGQLPEFPGVPDSILDVIPVDFVVNAILAAAVTPAKVDEPNYYQVVSGARNPLPFHTMYENVKEFFTTNPMPHVDGPIQVPSWRFPGGRSVERTLKLQERLASAADDVVGRMPSTTRTRRWTQALHRRQSGLTQLRYFAELYRAYVQTELIFDDRNTRALDATVPEELRADVSFNVVDIDWHDYFQNVHFPSITGLTKAYASRPAGKARAKRALPVRSDVLAVFDFEGTVVESNLVEQYLWVRLGLIPKAQWPQEFASLMLSVPKYLRVDHRDRGEFIRTLVRRYRGIKVADLEQLVQGRFGAAMLSRAIPDALDRVAQHRAAGHRTVLVTGATSSAAEPFAQFFDDVVAGEMHANKGVLTGYLATPPLVDEARAAWLREYATQHGANLTQSYGYGDSLADVAWLQLLGNATVVNPDTELYRHAQRTKWTVEDWTRRSSESQLVPGNLSLLPDAQRPTAAKPAPEEGDRSNANDAR
ncbi:HAD-IB family hydrolase [Herbiconiux ginsengi]|uniref:HAD-superfamily subfamily IB hydrolase, TIGR01490 n=1 Tax=Herbiconiux ginsengi TaxID=381665 RepID=A0A1H3QIJ8_9MICO|nr:HAD-IB family hydrolase [Herbiconiux ginsengi]SDZ13120.1 HAD-superfamily subfamily IB hydrolase, TIGR01490 [Herbiconiux ginsengi]